ncbi:hypothetical protein CIG75_08195 [Tumebacillus algifaecis]|uniref:Uncharacterized protein n=1 Tax=Tumebacillus algifaecis TaxID=1214604 RepID=A0A223D020_9BACL|nr:hypothetical protein [Tumebacillus algifaecis]ASS74968.1 hypothetical protein CIG75_08195 [Tumebacillus algifaecis]
MKLFLPVTLLLVTILLLGTQLALTTQDFRMTTELYRSDQAYYLAEAALLVGQSHLQQDPSWRGERMQIRLGAGVCSYRIYEQAGVVQIEATGEIGKVKTVQKKQAEPTSQTH